MKWQEASKLLISGGVVTIISVLAVMFQLVGVDYIDYGNSTCETIDGVYQCRGFFDVNSSYWSFGFDNLEPTQSIYLPLDLETFGGKLTKYKVSDLNFTPVMYKKSRYGNKLWINLFIHEHTASF